MLTETFGELAQSAKTVHRAALCCIVLVVILLMAPAAFHRIAYGGNNTEAFYRLGSYLIVIAALPLALGHYARPLCRGDPGLRNPPARSSDRTWNRAGPLVPVGTSAPPASCPPVKLASAG